MNINMPWSINNGNVHNLHNPVCKYVLLIKINQQKTQKDSYAYGCSPKNKQKCFYTITSTSVFLCFVLSKDVFQNFSCGMAVERVSEILYFNKSLFLFPQ